MQILEVTNVHKTLAKKEVLHGISFSVDKGEIYGFLGPNGAGKTTTMKSILGLITPESGSIKIFGQEGLNLETKKRIGFMPENTYLYKHLTGREFLHFNGSFFGFSGEELDKKIDELLKRVGLEASGDAYLKTYSKGMLQRVGLAQSIINDPELLFLDEPMSGLDPIGRKMVKDLLVSLKSSGTTIFFNTHILADVESICDTISIIHQGNIIVTGQSVKKLQGKLEDFFIEKVTENS
ncbi:ABC transporter ATP-binding protein [Candidatus Gracilibacteria bacterium]|nr:ABC transporter ATP-binding protein [Candidatus Gracilibacteria bacterium]